MSAVVTFLMCQGAIFGLGNGVLDELDFWGGNFCLVLFGTVETILFAWVYGMDKAWTEMHVGADIAIPRVYRFIIKYITPFALIALLIGWMYQEGWKTITMAEAKAANRPYILLTRLSLLAFFVALSVLVWVSWRRRAAKAAADIPGSESKCA
jgi:NSS family neurotransmitter:Na+ symporter